jgi:uncharacterized protein
MPSLTPLIENALRTRAFAECEKFPDPSHDRLHILRVVENARRLARKESAELDVVIPAAYLHDVVYISKQDPRRAEASRLSADEAVRFLQSIGYPEEHHAAIHHAIAAHSFSANLVAATIEAQVVQDADRLDALGAIGVARCFSLAGQFRQDFYHESEPFPETRGLNDRANALDHFFAKLLNLEKKLQTVSAREEGRTRTQFLSTYLQELKRELSAHLV